MMLLGGTSRVVKGRFVHGVVKDRRGRFVAQLGSNGKPRRIFIVSLPNNLRNRSARLLRMYVATFLGEYPHAVEVLS